MRRGIAIISTLIMVGIVAMMLVAMLLRLRGQGYLLVGGSQTTSALFAAESGLAECLSQMTALPTWASNLSNQPLMGSLDQSYSVQFPPSVNNLTGAAAVPGPRGPVAPGTAYLVVEGVAAGRRRTIEVVVGRRGPLPSSLAIMNDGVLKMQGDVQIDGIQSMANPVSVEVEIFSNCDVDAAGLIDWTPLQLTDSCQINGSVKIVSANPGAIDLAGASVLSTDNDQAPMTEPYIDIPSRVAAKSGASPVVLTPGVTTLGSGDYYVGPGGLSYNGDIQLNGANVYVEGPVDVNGTVRGNGSLFVTGTTSLYGDSQVTSSNDDNVALYSRGSVSLRGFDGSRFMDGLVATAGNDANGIPYATHWANAQSMVQSMQTILTTVDPAAPITADFGHDPVLDTQSRFDTLGDIIAHNAPDNHGGHGYSALESNPIGKLRALVAAQPAGPSRDFLMRKFDAMINPSDPLDGLFAHHTATNGPDAYQDIQDLLNLGSTNGIVDGVNDTFYHTSPQTWTVAQRVQLFNLLVATMNQIEYDRLGAAHFNGSVYTNGFVYAENEVSINGSLVAMDDGTQSPGNPDLLNPTLTVNPGDIYFNRGVRFTYVPAASDTSGNSLGSLGVLVWMSR